MRLLVWCHVSGLYNPIIPKLLLHAAHRVLFTSPCSFEADNVKGMLPDHADRMAVVHSCGGFDGFPMPPADGTEGVKAGYMGSLNFAKLHPGYVDFVSAVDLPDFKIRMIGDALNKDILERQCELAGRKGMLEFVGHAADVAAELSSINTLVYLLNPQHYGTTENALLESMAMGIVPVVLDNPVERHIVEHMKTGIIIREPGELADAVRWLDGNPSERLRLGRMASESVRERFAVGKMEAALNMHYSAVMSMPKSPVPFMDIFGKDPAEWFLSCQGNPHIFNETDGAISGSDMFSTYALHEKTKGTVYHFLKYFPGDRRLTKWAGKLAASKK
jgi:glycosyltransferase involved in cell wall biosynthesis